MPAKFSEFKGERILKMSKYVIKIITEVDDGCILTEYYKDITKNGDVVLTADLAEASLFDEEKKCNRIIDHLCVLLGYMPRTIIKEKFFQVNPKL